MTRRRYVGLDPAHEDAEPIVLYLDDPGGPETFEEALDAFVASCRDLWEVMAVPVAEKAAVKLQAGVDTWRDWWKPMDLSGPWTAGWTRNETVAAMVRRLLIDPWKETFRRACLGNQAAPPLTGIRGLRPFSVIVDEAIPPGKFGIIRTGLTPEQMARHRAEIPFPKAAFEANRIAYPLPDMPEGMTLEEWMDVHRPSRGFLDAATGDYLVDDGEDEVPESPWIGAMRDKIDRELGIFPEEDEDR